MTEAILSLDDPGFALCANRMWQALAGMLARGAKPMPRLLARALIERSRADLTTTVVQERLRRDLAGSAS